MMPTSNRKGNSLYGCVQTGATTPNIVAPTMLGPAVHRGKDTTHTCVMSVRGPNNVRRAVQTDPTLLR